jgi:hypothetical protein
LGGLTATTKEIFMYFRMSTRRVGARAIALMAVVSVGLLGVGTAVAATGDEWWGGNWFRGVTPGTEVRVIPDEGTGATRITTSKTIPLLFRVNSDQGYYSVVTTGTMINNGDEIVNSTGQTLWDNFLFQGTAQLQFAPTDGSPAKTVCKNGSLTWGGNLQEQTFGQFQFPGCKVFNGQQVFTSAYQPPTPGSDLFAVHLFMRLQ